MCIVRHDQCRVSYESLRAFAALQPRYGSIAVPLLAMHGSANSIASLEAVARLVDAAASADKQLLTWPGAYHELFHEPERDDVIDALLAWIARRAAAPEQREMQPGMDAAPRT
jgi:alpha-beta hydrolase superfamily lysophospholipase